jgi:hypothetical protein
MEFCMGQERTPANAENVAERNGVELRDFVLCTRWQLTH